MDMVQVARDSRICGMEDEWRAQQAWMGYGWK